MLTASLLIAALVVSIGLVVAIRNDGRRVGDGRSSAEGRVPFGMLGDSDTAAYQDRVTFAEGGQRPGGAFHMITFQWPEVLARIRGAQVDLGRWAVWGVPRWLSMARIRDGLKMPWRGPRKETYQHNLAWPGQSSSLTQGAWRQAQRLVDVMDEQSSRWRDGVVVIRTGINTLGTKATLDALAADPDDPGVGAEIAAAVAHVREAVRLIHASHPATRVVLVGVLNNADWPPYFCHWQSGEEQGNLQAGLDRYDSALRLLAESDPRLAFFDDRAWFAGHWGGRNPESGMPDYRSVRVGEHLVVSNSMGDSLEHAVLANGHAGLVWNVLWVQHLINLVTAQFGTDVDAISEAEVARFVAACAGVGDKLKVVDDEPRRIHA